MNKIKDLTGAKAFSFFGGVFGLILFLVIGLLPSIVYGGFSGVILANGIFGPTTDPTIWIKMMVVFGVAVGVMSTAGIFTVIGSISGALTYSLAERFALNGVKVRRKVEAKT